MTWQLQINIKYFQNVFKTSPLFQENTDETPDLTILRVCDLRDACFQNDKAP